LFRPDLEAEQLHLVAWAVALAATSACRELAGVQLRLKWPNDLLAAASDVVGAQPPTEKKLAGVLSEILPAAPGARPCGEAEGPTHGAVVVGIGINVNWPPDWPPPDSNDPDLVSMAAQATSLNRIAGRQIDRVALVSRLLAHAGAWNARLHTPEGRDALTSEYRRGSATIGRDVRVELPDETVAGRALDVDAAGCLLVSTGTCVRTIAAGDVVHVR
jgi:BirA family biotin operon repressor/biotin-[acetyl-CoA-carboxylase] ligase